MPRLIALMVSFPPRCYSPHPIRIVFPTGFRNRDPFSLSIRGECSWPCVESPFGLRLDGSAETLVFGVMQSWRDALSSGLIEERGRRSEHVQERHSDFCGFVQNKRAELCTLGSPNETKSPGVVTRLFSVPRAAKFRRVQLSSSRKVRCGARWVKGL